MRWTILLALLWPAGCGAPAPVPDAAPEVATFSVVAFDPSTGDLGVAVQSKVFGVGVVVPYVRADVGAIATQALANPEYGPAGLEMLDDGVPAEEVVKRLTDADHDRERRQLGVVDWRGRAAAFTGKRTFAWAGHEVGEHYCCQGNIVAGGKVVDDMAAAFEAAKGPLAERLLAALKAGQVAGGDKRGRQSAALVVARRNGGYLRGNDRYVDLRVDDHEKPIEELARLLAKRRSALPDAPVPERLVGLVRESRHAPEGGATARSTWETWMRHRRAGDLRAIWMLCNERWREEHTLQDLAKIEADAGNNQGLAARGTYVGTGYTEREDEPHLGRLFFAVPGRAEAVMVLLVREKGHWRIVP